MKYQLVLQFDGAAIEDFDDLLKLELELQLTLESEHVVDGHDFGSAEMNIFIHTNQPEEAFLAAKSMIKKTMLENVVAAYREIEGDEYCIIYPENYEGVLILPR